MGVPTAQNGLPVTTDILNFPMQIPYCHVYTSGTISLNNTTTTTLTWASERRDPEDMHDTVTNPSRLTVVTAGIWRFTAQVAWDTSATGARIATIRKGGTTTLGRVQIPAASSGGTVALVIAEDIATIGDYYEVTAYQSSGGALGVRTGVSQTWFSASFIREG